ncbi:Ribonuclease H-like domain containing protein [Trema orientale]|uniref:Ribonuclease H-like domain containing protein n=1 Tax=Trema orientale TaxID=63057 RepID=A0A2P5C4E0_TREOI|nr:Ribonuclease H-like domain containing protein [Trema orientale]
MELEELTLLPISCVNFIWFRELRKTRFRLKLLVSLHAPSAGGLKLNTDASVTVRETYTSLGAVIHDHDSSALACCSCRIPRILSPKNVELLAILGGLLFVRRLGFNIESVESDALNAVRGATDSFPLADNALYLFISDIKTLMRYVNCGTYHYIPKNGNSVWPIN